jgi:hypothetical protein
MRRNAMRYHLVRWSAPLVDPSQRTAVYGLRQRLGSPRGRT